MRNPFIPKEYSVPTQFEFGDYNLFPITTKDVFEDWLVITSNADMIVQQRGGGSRKEWPFVCTLEENYQDLAWLEVCARYKQLFCFILRNKKDNSYAGAVYIYPIELFFSKLAGKYDVDFSFWITRKEYESGNYENIFKELLDWLVDVWHFSRNKIYLRNRELPKSLL